MKEQITRIKRELIHKGTILDIYKDTMQLPDGNTEEWDFVSHRNCDSSENTDDDHDDHQFNKSKTFLHDKLLC